MMKTNKIRKEIEKYAERRFVQEGKRLPSELPECLAVKRRAQRQGANESSKEPTKAGRNNRSLARKTTSVVWKWMGTICQRIVPICVFITFAFPIKISYCAMIACLIFPILLVLKNKCNWNILQSKTQFKHDQ